MQLAVENKINKINVSDVAAKAMINRSTFYLHYSDVADVVKDIENDIAIKLSAHFSKFDINNIYVSTFDIFTHITEALDGDEVLKNYIIFSTDSDRMANRLKEIMAETTMNALLRTFSELNAEDIAYSITFVAAGIVESYLKWAQSKNRAKPLETLIAEVSHYTDYIIEKLTENVN